MFLKQLMVFMLPHYKNSIGFKVSPRQLETRVFLVNRMNINRKGSSSMSVSGSDLAESVSNQSGGSSINRRNQRSNSNEDSGGSSSSVTTSYDDSKWNRLQLTVEQLIGVKKEISLNSSILK